MEQPAAREGLRSFEELYVYRLARDFRKSISSLAKNLPQDERFNLTSQMRRAALSVTNNIAEGIGRYYYQENIQFCRQARGSDTELIDCFDACMDEGNICQRAGTEFQTKSYEILKVLKR